MLMTQAGVSVESRGVSVRLTLSLSVDGSRSAHSAHAQDRRLRDRTTGYRRFRAPSSRNWWPTHSPRMLGGLAAPRATGRTADGSPHYAGCLSRPFAWPTMCRPCAQRGRRGRATLRAGRIAEATTWTARGSFGYAHHTDRAHCSEQYARVRVRGVTSSMGLAGCPGAWLPVRTPPPPSPR